MTRRVVIVLLAGLAACSSSSSNRAAPVTVTLPDSTTTTTVPREQIAPARTRFTVDGRAVDLICRGHGRIPVVFLAGGREPGTVWNGLIESLGDDVFTCVFDRPGTTAETIDQPPSELTTPRAVGDALAEALEQAMLGPQIVLVGHSASGPSVLAFGDAHPLRVAGTVLFDPTVPDLIPDDEWKRVGFDPDATGQQTNAITHWPDVPIVVLTADAELVVKNHEATAAEERAWIAGHQRYAALSSAGEQREVPDTSHFVYVSAPKVAADAVRQVLRTADG